jgi:hypothetical protein
MRSRKIHYTCSKTTYLLIPNITWKTNFLNPSCVSLNLFWARGQTLCVSQKLVHKVYLNSCAVSGDHTRTIQIATPTVGGLMKFAVKTVTCLGCKTPLKPTNSVKGGAVCNNCRPRISELYQRQVDITSEQQVRFARLWTQCQRCQGSLHQVSERL